MVGLALSCPVPTCPAIVFYPYTIYCITFASMSSPWKRKQQQPKEETKPRLPNSEPDASSPQMTGGRVLGGAIGVRDRRLRRPPSRRRRVLELLAAPEPRRLGSCPPELGGLRKGASQLALQRAAGRPWTSFAPKSAILMAISGI